jgi:16S rRNA (guanine527-N7)-methyltransferase
VKRLLMPDSFELAELFRAQTLAWGISLSDAQTEKLFDYARLLSTYSEANVVGEKEESNLILNHVLDSLSCLLVRETVEAGSLVDVGSGGGLPGIPLAIAQSKTRVTLLEATGKKTSFLRLAVERLALDNAGVLNGRAEDVGNGGRRGQYDAATSRAVASLAVLAEYCLPLLKVGGVAVAMKAEPSAAELEAGGAAARELGGVLREVEPVPVLPEVSDRRRSLVVLEKREKTPAKYPRRPGLPRKHPLGGL